MFDEVMDDQFLSEQSNLDSLRETAKSWTADEWAAYLATLDSPLKEKLVSERKYLRISETTNSSAFDFAQRSSNGVLHARLQAALDELTIRERKVLDLIYFKSRTYREVSDELDLWVSWIFRIHLNAVRKIRRSLILGVNTLPLVTGKVGGIGR